MISGCGHSNLVSYSFTGEKYKQRSFGWVWLEGGSNQDLEQALDVGGFGYPALVAVNARKAVYSSMRGPYNAHGIKDFIR